MDRVTELGAARNPVHTTNWKGSAHRGSGRCSLKSNDSLLKGLTHVASQNRRILCLLAYVAVVTSCPLIGAALFFRAQGRIAAFRKRLLKQDYNATIHLFYSRPKICITDCGQLIIWRCCTNPEFGDGEDFGVQNVLVKLYQGQGHNCQKMEEKLSNCMEEYLYCINVSDCGFE